MVNLLDIIKRKDVARRNGAWLEAVALAHLFIETQLDLIVTGLTNPKGQKPAQNEIDQARKGHVFALGKLARSYELIRDDTWEAIQACNVARNKAIHGLAKGEITYEVLQKHVTDADALITDLQRYYIEVTAYSEISVESA